MVRLHRALVVCALACLAAACVVAGSRVEVEAEAESRWPTLLEATAMASDKFTPAGRNRLERMAQIQSPSSAPSIGAHRAPQQLFFGDGMRGHKADSEGNRNEHDGRAREPQANPRHFGGPSYIGAPPAYALNSRAPRSTCKGGPCQRHNHGPISIPPVFVPIPIPPPVVNITNHTEHRAFPTPPAPELPLATPVTPPCGELCAPKGRDPILTRIPSPPLDDAGIAAIGLEGEVLKQVVEKLRNREGWLRAQKMWLSKAVEAAATVRREIDMAEQTKEQVAQDLAQLKEAQDNISLKYKVSRLKWAYKDRKITLEKIKERYAELNHQRSEVSKQMREAKDEETILVNTLGPPSEQIILTPQEVEEPLKFLEDVVAEAAYADYTKGFF